MNRRGFLALLQALPFVGMLFARPTLVAVGQDVDGTIKPIDELSYRSVGGWGDRSIVWIEWIRVQERRPSPLKIVQLVVAASDGERWVTQGYVQTVKADGSNAVWVTDRNRDHNGEWRIEATELPGVLTFRVTHWAELPAPPEMP
jgi:hypothetical protein